MNNKLTAAERRHLQRVKSLSCSVCNMPPPSEAHHYKQHRQYLCIALCASCHRDNFNGIHGQRRMWAVKKMDELDALNETIRRLIEDGYPLEDPDEKIF